MYWHGLYFISVCLFVILLFRPKLESLSAVMQGPFLRDEAVVVTESNGSTIRHANSAFAKLAGRPLDKHMKHDR